MVLLFWERKQRVPLLIFCYLTETQREKGRVIRNREGVRVSLRVLQSCIVFCEEHELLLLELKERNRDSKEKRRTCCSQKKPPRVRVLREFSEN